MSKVTFSAETINKLKKLNNINQSIKIVPGNGVLRSVNESKTVAVETPFTEVLPRTLCIYDLREFLSIMNIIKDPVVDLSNPKYSIIQSADGTQKIRYVDAGENVVNSSYMAALPNIPAFELSTVVSEENLKSAMNAATSLGLAYIGFTCDGNELYLKAFDQNEGDNNETNAFSILLGTNTNKFKMFYKTDAWKVLEGECSFNISKAKVSKVVTSDMTFLMTLDAKSTFA